MTDLQSQREGESDRAYRAYLIFRDLGVDRSLSKAFEIYSNGKKAISGSFHGWTVSFDWESRVRDWEAQKRSLIQDAELARDREDYLRRLEEGRDRLEKTAMMALRAAELAIVTGITQLQRLVTKIGDRSATAAELYEFSQIIRSGLNAMNLAAVAKTELYDALGLAKVIQTIEGKN